MIVTIAQLIFTLLLYAIGILIIGLCIAPGLLLIYFVWIKTSSYIIILRILYLALSFAAGYFIYGITLIFTVGSLRSVFRLNLKEGDYPIVSAGTMRWEFVNALFLLVSVTFMDFILLTPFCPLFYLLMGAKMGRDVQINSKNVADISLLEIGDRSVIGGNATVICHSFESGRLRLRKVKIGKDVVVGLNSVILPGAEIGDRATVAAGAVLSKDTKVGPGEMFGGIPAKKIVKE